jgi:hypothetical protein
MAGVTTAQGSWTTPASGTTTVTVGFQPNAILFWVSGPNGVTNDTWANNIGASYGAAAYDGTNYYNSSVTTMAKYATTGAEVCGCATTTNRCFAYYNTSGTLIVSGYVTSVTGTTFVITYGTAAANYTVFYLAIGGDVSAACIAQWTMDASADTQTVALPNSLSWKPSAVIHATSNYGTSWNNNQSDLMIGAMDGVGNQFGASYTAVNEGTSAVTNDGRCMSTSYCLCGSSSNNGAIDAYLTYNSLNAGNFKVTGGGANYTNWIASTPIWSLCLYNATGNEILVGSWAKSTAGAPATDTVAVTGMTTVQGALFVSDADTTFEGTTGARLLFGGADGTHNGCITVSDKNGQTKNTGASAYSVMETAKSLLVDRKSVV